MEDWQDDWYWHDSEGCSSEWYDNESAYLVCGVAGSSPRLNQQSKDKVKLMIDSGSQSTAWTLRKATRQMTLKEQSCGTFRIRKLKHVESKLLMCSFMATPMRLLSQPASRWMCQMLREMLLRWADC